MITVEKYIIGLDNIINKNVNSVTTEEVISLIFHSFASMKNEDVGWRLCYDEFICDLNLQNTKGWPKVTISKNFSSNRCDLKILSESYLRTNNFLSLLFRLLFIENYKKENQSPNSHLEIVLNHQHTVKNNFIIEEITIQKLFKLLRLHLTYYQKIYNTRFNIEYDLAKKIITHLSKNST